MRCNEMIRKLEELSPISYAESWDNPGLLAGRYEKEIKKVYIALDATTEVIEEAIRCEADMILTHHPLIFKGIKKVNSEDFVGRRILSMLQADVCYYAMHTNFDVMGMADAAADKLSLEERKVLEVTYEKDGVAEGIGRIGILSQNMTLDACAKLVKKVFGIEWVKVFGDSDMQIKKVAISPGSGKSMIGAALNGKADVLITGDIGHHEGIDAVAQNLAIIDAGHYGIEHIFIEDMKEYFNQKLPELIIGTAAIEHPFQTI